MHVPLGLLINIGLRVSVGNTLGVYLAHVTFTTDSLGWWYLSSREIFGRRFRTVPYPLVVSSCVVMCYLRYLPVSSHAGNPRNELCH